MMNDDYKVGECKNYHMLMLDILETNELFPGDRLLPSILQAAQFSRTLCEGFAKLAQSMQEMGDMFREIFDDDAIFGDPDFDDDEDEDGGVE